MPKSCRFLTMVFLVTAMLTALADSALYAQRKPLLVEGKTTLFQRLITHPGAIPHSAPGGAESGPPLVSFTALYVYDMKFEEGNRWYEVGPDSKGTGTYWLNFEYVTLWNNNMTVMFAEKAGRPLSVMFFKTADYLKDLAMKAGIEAILQKLLTDFDNFQKTKTAPPSDFPVVAKEPGDEAGAIPNQNFYLMPILSLDNSLEGLKFLEVVAINPGNPDEMQPKGEGTPKKTDTGKKVGIAFVIDTTISMGEYIEASKEICNYIFKMVKDSGHVEDFYLAFVAFRSSVDKSPGLEYTTKLISDFTPATNQANFDAALNEVAEAKVSSHSFNEDSIAGLNRALDLDWGQFSGGAIILITDAGPLDLSDPSKASGDSATTIAERAKEKKVHIVPIHLKTPGGQKNYAYAEKNYRQMATQFGGTPSYIDLKVSNATQGATRYSSFMEGFADTMQSALLTGKMEENPADKPAKDEDAQAGARVGGFIGYSIYLNWLGQSNDTSPVSVVRSWISDKDMGLMEKDTSLQVPTVDICILLSRSQLSALADTLTKLVDIAESVIDNDDVDFFTAILNSSLISSTDPKNLEVTSATRLGELGVMEEFLEGLPYDSEIMTLTKADWDAMPAPAQRDFLLRLKSKIGRYQKLNDDLEGWYKTGEDAGEWLYRVPLTLLP